MIKIGFVKEAFRGVPHIVAIKSGPDVHIKALTEFGNSIMRDGLNMGADGIQRMPDGFVFSGFMPLNQSYSTIVKSSFPEIETKQLSNISINKPVNQVVSRHLLKKSTHGPEQVVLKPILNTKSNFDKSILVSFKALSFKKFSRRTKFAQNIKAGFVAADMQRAQIKAIPSSRFSHQLVDEVKNIYGEGFIRKTLILSKDNLFPSSSSRRAMRRSYSITSPDGYSKSNHRLARMAVASFRR